MAIDDAMLDQQLAEVEEEQQQVTDMNCLQDKLQGLENAESTLDSAERVLRELNGRLDSGLTFELKREIVETLVERIDVETVVEGGRREALVHVRYRFGAPQRQRGRAEPASQISNRSMRIDREILPIRSA